MQQLQRSARCTLLSLSWPGQCCGPPSRTCTPALSFHSGPPLLQTLPLFIQSHIFFASPVRPLRPRSFRDPSWISNPASRDSVPSIRVPLSSRRIPIPRLVHCVFPLSSLSSRPSPRSTSGHDRYLFSSPTCTRHPTRRTGRLGYYGQRLPSPDRRRDHRDITFTTRPSPSDRADDDPSSSSRCCDRVRRPEAPHPGRPVRMTLSSSTLVLSTHTARSQSRRDARQECASDRTENPSTQSLRHLAIARPFSRL